MLVLGIDADLSAPPSSPTSYREVTMFAKVHRNYQVLALCPDWEIDSYVRWFRIYGLFDYVDDILSRERAGDLNVDIAGGPEARLTAFNVMDVLAAI